MSDDGVASRWLVPVRGILPATLELASIRYNDNAGGWPVNHACVPPADIPNMSEAQYRNDLWGSLGEHALAYSLGFPPPTQETQRRDQGWDAVVRGWTVDVKAAPSPNGRLLIQYDTPPVCELLCLALIPKGKPSRQQWTTARYVNTSGIIRLAGIITPEGFYRHARKMTELRYPCWGLTQEHLQPMSHILRRRVKELARV